MVSKLRRKKPIKIFFVLFLVISWLFSGWPPIWLNPRIPSKIKEGQALNKVNNWDFTGSSTGWTYTSDTGTDLCGSTTTTNEISAETGDYDGTIGNPSGSFKFSTPVIKKTLTRGKITQTFVAPGSGTVKAKGRFDYYAVGSSWRTQAADSSWIRLDLYDSGETTYVASLGCASFTSDQSWTTTSWSSDTNLTGGTTYTVRATFRSYTGTVNASNSIWIDNVIVNFAPTGLFVSAPDGSTNALLSWTTSTAGTGAPGLHSTNSYNIFRDSSFLSIGTTNSYTDTSSAANTTYSYTIEDLDTNGVTSPLSAAVNLLTRPGVPTTPTFTNVQSTSLRVGWTAPTGGAVSYKIERCSGSGCSNFSQITAGETNLYYDNTGLTAETLYRYCIRATNATGDGACSGIGEVTTPVTAIISVSIVANSAVMYGTVATSKSTIQLGTTPILKNEGNVTESFRIKTSNATVGVGTTWVVGSTAGVNIFVHEFSTNGGGLWTALSTADSYQDLVAGVGVGNTQPFDLRITVPTDPTDYQERTIQVTILATQTN